MSSYKVFLGQRSSLSNLELGPIFVKKQPNTPKSTDRIQYQWLEGPEDVDWTCHDDGEA